VTQLLLPFSVEDISGIIGPAFSLEDVTRKHIHEVLSIAGGDRRLAARLLGIGQSTLYRLIQREQVYREILQSIERKARQARPVPQEPISITRVEPWRSAAELNGGSVPIDTEPEDSAELLKEIAEQRPGSSREREVVKCSSCDCKLVQFRSIYNTCRRCGKVLPPRTEAAA
jgi:hypothetical protein